MLKELLILKKIKEHKQKYSNFLEKFLITMFIFGFIIILSFVSYIGYLIINNRSIDKFLPNNKTLLYIEFLDNSLPYQLNEKSILDIKELSQFSKSLFSFDVTELKEHISQSRNGFALINKNSENKGLLFFRAKSKKDIINYFKSLAISEDDFNISNEDNYKIYSYKQSYPFSFIIISKYVFLANDKDILKTIVKVKNKEIKSLSQNEDYIKTMANLPNKSWAKAYLNIKNLKLDKKNKIFYVFEAFKELSNTFALSIRKDEKALHINTFMHLKDNMIPSYANKINNSVFSYSLSEVINSKNLALYIGGENLSEEWEASLKTLEELNPMYSLILEGILRAKVNDIFGRDVDLRNDIYPLFSNEYAFTVSNAEDGNPVFKLILKHNNKEFTDIKMKKLKDGFIKLASQFIPTVKSFQLDSGKNIQEVVSNNTKINEINEEYKLHDIHCSNLELNNYSLCYSVDENLVFISNSIDSIKESIDLLGSQKFVLSQSPLFRKSLSNLSLVSDEITFINMNTISKILENTKLNNIILNFKDNLSKIDSVTWVKHYFKNASSLDAYIILK